MKIKIYISDIVMVLFFHISFISMPYIQSYNLLKYAVAAITAVFLLPKFKLFFRKKYKAVNISLLVFLAVIIITSYINKNAISSRNVFLASIIYCIIILEGFLLFQYYEYKEKTNHLFKIIFYLLLFYVIITDMLIFLKPGLLIQHEGYYFIGNKFTVAYTHIFLTILYWLLKSNGNSKLSLENKLSLFLMFCLTIFISIYINSGSGIVASVFLILLMCFKENMKKLMSNPITPIASILVSCSFFFLFGSILGTSIMRFIVVNVLGKDPTLTGRMIIYSNVADILPGHIFTGYGHGSTFEVCMELIGAPNTQNGLMEILTQYGIFGVISFFVLIYMCFKNHKISNINAAFPLVAMLYIYILLASIEITLSQNFILVLGLVILLFNNNGKNKTSHQENCNARTN